MLLVRNNAIKADLHVVINELSNIVENIWNNISNGALCLLQAQGEAGFCSFIS